MSLAASLHSTDPNPSSALSVSFLPFVLVATNLYQLKEGAPGLELVDVNATGVYTGVLVGTAPAATRLRALSFGAAGTVFFR